MKPSNKNDYQQVAFHLENALKRASELAQYDADGLDSQDPDYKASEESLRRHLSHVQNVNEEIALAQREAAKSRAPKATPVADSGKKKSA